MYAVEVREHVMIAHSLKGAVFGPAQGMHGATFVVDAAFFSKQLDANGIVVDIGCALDVLKTTLQPLAYQNLDVLDVFEGVNTTTEFLAGWIFRALRDAARANKLGRPAAELSHIRITLSESHIARAWFEGPVNGE